MRVPPIEQFTVSGPAHAYVASVKDHFPHISDQLANRLGEANWQRHQELRLDHDEHAPVLAVDSSDTQYIFRDSGYGSKGLSLQSFTPSLKSAKSHSSFKSRATFLSAGRPRVPHMPSEVQNGSKPCPYCGKILRKQLNRETWK